MWLKTWYEKKLKETGRLAQFIRRWRRFLLSVFYPEYVQRSIAQTRTGECNRSGVLRTPL